MFLLIAIIIIIIVVQTVVFFLGRKRTLLVGSILSDTSFTVSKAYIPNNIINKIVTSNLITTYKKYKSCTDDVVKEPVVDFERLGRMRLKAVNDGVSFDENEAKKSCTTFKTKIICKAENKVEVLYISYNGRNTNPIVENILSAINTYLLKNRGAASDFHLIKDIVERNCDATENEIESIKQIPLYLGLIGTISGIITGLGEIYLTGGFAAIKTVVDTMMGEIALAMLASFFGVLYTSCLTWMSKEASHKLENNKNVFYSWIQTELLPVLSKNVVSTLSLLERNLTHFNDSFKSTVDGIGDKLGTLGATYRQQEQILTTIRNLDVVKVSQINASTTASLQDAVKDIKVFADYINTTTTYLREVQSLNAKIDEHLDRTKHLEQIAAFYQKREAEIKKREDQIENIVEQSDKIMQLALDKFSQKTSQSLSKISGVFEAEEMKLDSLMQTRASLFDDKMRKLDSIINLINQMGTVISATNKLEKSNEDNTRAMNSLVDAIKVLIRQNGGNSESRWWRR